jgi:secreted PhoX family phosphatase
MQMSNDNNVILSQAEPTTDPSNVSRRQLFRGAAAAAGGAALLLSTTLPAEAKVTQQAAGYQTTPHGDQNCASCTHFKAPASCVLVEDPIAPTGWCKLYAKPS